MYAILDIETTGGKYNEEGITEIAIYRFDGHNIVDQFISLVNPEREIQPFVEKLTGINNKMLRNAPKFHEIAKRIIEITDDCVLVAHNSSFDYRILRTEFRRLGYDYKKLTLCTVELSKKLIPDQESYSLGKLCRSLGIPVSNRHRAEGDTIATVKLFKLLLDKDVNKEIITNNIKNEVDKELVPKLQNIVDELPSTIGVYYFHDENGNILYIGHGSNIKKSVNRQFLKTNKRAKTLQGLISDVSYELSGNRLISQLKYTNELTVNKPKFNSFYPKHKNDISFNNENMIVSCKGRHPNEKGVLLIENNKLIGYGFVDLSYQVNNIDILKTLISPIEDNNINRNLVKNYLNKNKVEKIIRF